MSLIRFFIRNPAFTLTLTLCVCALGLNAWLSVPRSEDPLLSIPAYTVILAAPGMNPVDLERLVVRPVEDSIKELDSIEKLNSSIRDGLATVNVEFTYGLDTDRKHDEVIRQVGVVRPELPDGVARVEIRPVRTINVAMAQVALVSGEAGYDQLGDLAEVLKRRLEAVPGVRKAEKWAFPPKQVHVTLDLARLRESGLPATAVVEVLRQGNLSLPGGSVELGERRFTVKTSGTFSSLDEIEQVVLRSEGTGVLRVGDVAQVEWDYEEPEHLGRFSGERAVFVTAMPQEGSDALGIRAELDATLERFKVELPASVRLERGFDQAANVQRRIGRLQTDFLIAFAIVILTVLPLGLRASVLVMLSIPLSLALGLAAMAWAGQTLNQLSIVGFVIALGLLVDDSIVVVENIARFRRMGVSPGEAAERATNQIAVAVVGTTAALVFAFLPLMLLPGGAGQFIRPLPLAVVFTVTASLFVALALIPLFARWMLTGREDTEGSRALRLLQQAIHAIYRPVLHFCMRRRGLTLIVSALLLLGSIALLPAIGFSLFPRAGTPQFSIRIEADEGTGFEGTDARVRAVEKVLAATPEIEWWFANVGRGNPQIYYNEIPSENRSSVGEIFVQWSVASERDYARRAEALRKRLSEVAGARIVVKEFENGPPITAPIVVKLLGDDLEALVASAAQIEGVLARVEGTRDVENPVRVPRTDLRVRIDRARAGLAGVQEQEIDRAARLAIAGIEATRFREEDGDEYGILVGVGRGTFADLANWDRTLVASPSGPIPLNQVATLEFVSSPALIQRDKRERSISVNAFVREGFNTGKVTSDLERQLNQEKFPEGIRWRFGGEVESREESFSGIGSAVVIAAFGILAVLVLEFKSFRGTLIVASVVPLGIVGGLVALWLTGNSLSFTAAIGFVALMGIEIKNSILLVDFTNQLRDEGVALETAIEQAGETRFLPVVLTTATAIGALLPLAIEGSGLYSPLAIVLIGGLCSSLVLSRVVTPVLYSLLPPERGPSSQEATAPHPG